MKKIVLVLTLLGCTQLFAQEKKETPKAKKEKKEIIIEDKNEGDGKKVIEKKVTVRSNGGKEKKMTIIVDDGKVTVNGKPVEELKDEDMDILIENGDNLTAIAPRLRSKMHGFGNNFSMDKMDGLRKIFINRGSNKALLGVQTKVTDNGAEVTEVNEGSAAEKAGLKKGDIIKKVDDKSINEEYSLYKAIGNYKPEEKISITYVRDGKEKTATATLDKNKEEAKILELEGEGDIMMPLAPDMPPMPDMPEIAPFRNGDNFHFNFKMNKPKMGIKVQDLEEGDGVKILQVDDATPAQKAGLQKDDVVTAVNGDAIKTVDDFRQKTRDIKEGETAKITVNRNGKSQVIDVKFPKKLKTAEL